VAPVRSNHRVLLLERRADSHGHGLLTVVQMAETADGTCLEIRAKG
jgi:hypothetical protein